MHNILTPRFWSPFQMIVMSFLGLIAAGTILLMIPAATAEGKGAPFLTAFFTTVSASCVTADRRKYRNLLVGIRTGCYFIFDSDWRSGGRDHGCDADHGFWAPY